MILESTDSIAGKIAAETKDVIAASDPLTLRTKNCRVARTLENSIRNTKVNHGIAENDAIRKLKVNQEIGEGGVELGRVVNSCGESDAVAKLAFRNASLVLHRSQRIFCLKERVFDCAG